MSDFGKRRVEAPAPKKAEKVEAVRSEGAGPGIALYGIGAVAAAVVLGGGSAYVMRQPAAPVARIAAITDPGDCMADFQAISLKSRNMGPSRMDAKIDVKGMSMRLSAETVPPRDVSGRMTVMGREVEFVVKDKEGFLKVNGRWMSFPGMAKQMEGQMASMTAIQNQAVSSVTCLGSETFQGRDVIAYNAKGKHKGVETTTLAYFDAASKNPVHFDVTGNGPMGAMKMSFDIEADPSIQIEKPTVDPTAKLPAGMPGLGTAF